MERATPLQVLECLIEWGFLPDGIKELLHSAPGVAVFKLTTKGVVLAVKVYTLEHAKRVRQQMVHEQVAADHLDGHLPVMELQLTQVNVGPLTAVVYLWGGACMADIVGADQGVGLQQPRCVELGDVARCFAASALLALQHIHSKGFIVQDLKLDNFLFYAESLLVRMIDFGGCVRANAGPLAPVITRGMLSPEEAAQPHALYHLRPMTLSQPSDLYKVGLCLIYILFGELPPELRWLEAPGNTWAAFQAHCAAVVRWGRLHRWGPWLRRQMRAQGVEDAELLDFLLKLLEPNPAKRITAQHALEQPWVAPGVAQVAPDLLRLRAQVMRDRAAALAVLGVGPHRRQPNCLEQQQQQQQQQPVVVSMPITISASPKPAVADAGTSTDPEPASPAAASSGAAAAAAAAAAGVGADAIKLAAASVASSSMGPTQVEGAEGPGTPPAAPSRAVSQSLPGHCGRRRSGSVDWEDKQGKDSSSSQHGSGCTTTTSSSSGCEEAPAAAILAAAAPAEVVAAGSSLLEASPSSTSSRVEVLGGCDNSGSSHNQTNSSSMCSSAGNDSRGNSSASHSSALVAAGHLVDAAAGGLVAATSANNSACTTSADNSSGSCPPPRAGGEWQAAGGLAPGQGAPGRQEDVEQLMERAWQCDLVGWPRTAVQPALAAPSFAAAPLLGQAHVPPPPLPLSPTAAMQPKPVSCMDKARRWLPKWAQKSKKGVPPAADPLASTTEAPPAVVPVSQQQQQQQQEVAVVPPKKKGGWRPLKQLGALCDGIKLPACLRGSCFGGSRNPCRYDTD